MSEFKITTIKDCIYIQEHIIEEENNLSQEILKDFYKNPLYKNIYTNIYCKQEEFILVTVFQVKVYNNKLPIECEMKWKKSINGEDIIIYNIEPQIFTINNKIYLYSPELIIREIQDLKMENFKLKEIIKDIESRLSDLDL